MSRSCTGALSSMSLSPASLSLNAYAGIPTNTRQRIDRPASPVKEGAAPQAESDPSADVTVNHQSALADIDRLRGAIKPASKWAQVGIYAGWIPVVGSALSYKQRQSLQKSILEMQKYREKYPDLAPLVRKAENLAKDSRTSSNTGIIFGILPFFASGSSSAVYNNQQLAIDAIDRTRDAVSLYKGKIPKDIVERNIDRQENARNTQVLSSSGQYGNALPLLGTFLLADVVSDAF